MDKYDILFIKESTINCLRWLKENRNKFYKKYQKEKYRWLMMRIYILTNKKMYKKFGEYNAKVYSRKGIFKAFTLNMRGKM